MALDASIAAWEQALTRDSGRSAATVQHYVGDARRIETWFEAHAPGGTLAVLTPGDVRDDRDALLAAGRAPTTINRALISLGLRCDHAGRRRQPRAARRCRGRGGAGPAGPICVSRRPILLTAVPTGSPAAARGDVPPAQRPLSRLYR